MSNNFKQFFELVSIPNIDISSLSFPRISVAVSGGGYRSMLTSSGFILGMQNASLWGCTSHIAGISGGSWTLMKLVVASFDVESLSVFDLEKLVLEGIPNFDIKNHDLTRQEDFGNDDLNNNRLFSIDEEFAKDLKRQAELKKRDLGSEIYNELEEMVKDKHGSDFEFHLSKRSLESMMKLKNVVEDFFGKEDEAQLVDLQKIEELMKSFSHIRKTIGFYLNLHRVVRQKKEAGFPVSFTDYLGQALLDRIPVQKVGSIASFSDLASQEVFLKYEAPVPIMLANAKASIGEQLKNVVFEFSPFEFGSWHSRVSKFIPTKLLGSTVRAGKLVSCVEGFDNLGFITATSSSLFNNALVYIWKTVTNNIDSDEKLRAIKTVFSIFGIGFDALRPDYAIYQPNPFYLDTSILESISKRPELLLVDGGEDGENIPLRPFLIGGRQIDLVLIIDSSSDADNLPNMTKLRDTFDNVVNHEQQKRLVKYDDAIFEINVMPHIPSMTELAKSNFSLNKPIAFGCYFEAFKPVPRKKKVKESTKLPPILVYYGNTPVVFQSNTSTFKLNYTSVEFNGMLNNGYHIFNQAGIDDQYLSCLGCIMLLRQNDLENSTFCHMCFKEYCYN